MYINNNDIPETINGYQLDYEQWQAATCRSTYSIIIAGAGSGKSTTMVGKIKYLIYYLKINPKDILCISFTNDATTNLKKSIYRNCNVDIEVLTFHKLAINILKNNHINLNVANQKMLNYVIDEFFYKEDNDIAKYNLIIFLKSIFYSRSTEEYKRILRSQEYICFKKLLITFINMYRSKYQEIDKLKALYKSCKKYKEKAFFTLAIAIYSIYDKEKESQGIYDFDDLIKYASIVINNNGIIHSYKYIIIDEFQDTSLIRLYLIKAIIHKTSAHLTVVGDDFQSIYRFNGCNLDIFLNFNKIFPQVKVFKIQNTYRNSQELITVAGSFIMRNNAQIKKILKSNKHLKKPIKIIFQKEKAATLKNLIIYLYNENVDEILILGRNSFDIKHYIDKDFLIDDDHITLKGYEKIKIRYLTIHKSKGLEAISVIIINLVDNELGFPNKMVDHRILKYINNTDDEFLYAEERRLFYVALTRTKKNVYLLTQKNNISIFVKELLRYYYSYIEIITI